MSIYYQYYVSKPEAISLILINSYKHFSKKPVKRYFTLELVSLEWSNLIIIGFNIFKNF